MRKIENKFYNESYYEHTFSSGLKGIFIPKAGFTKTYAIIGVKFGSLYQEFNINGKDIKTPAGVAHFLEHKMFELPNGESASNKFAELGASDNAFTTYDYTAFKFTTTSNFDESLKLLLSMVSRLDVTEESVNKERSIITQELASYLNVPQEQLVNHFYEQAYSTNYLRVDIGGTIDTIKEITPEVLHTAFDAFYHPKNMILAVVGNIDLDHIEKLVEDSELGHTQKPFLNPIVNFRDNDEIVSTYGEYKMDISDYKVLVGTRLDHSNLDPLTTFKNSMYFDILFDIFLADSSNHYQTLLRKGYLDYSFGYATYFERHYAYCYFSSNSKNIKKTQNTFTKLYDLICNYEVTEEEFNHYKNLQVARSIKQFNSLESIARYSVEFAVGDLDFLDALGEIEKLNFKEFLEFRKLLKDRPLITTVIKK